LSKQLISIITITAFGLVATGLIAIPAIDQQQAHISIFKDSANKVKNLVKHVVGKISHKVLAMAAQVAVALAKATDKR
jgi:hypothetical protein